MTRLLSPRRNSGRPGSISSFSWGRPGSVYISLCWSPAWRSEKQKVDAQRPLSESLKELSPDGHPLVRDPLLNRMGMPQERCTLLFPRSSALRAHPLEVWKDWLRWSGGMTPPRS